jgi:hypothetical protein
MKKSIFLILFILSSFVVFSQGDASRYLNHTRGGDKYLIALGYGMGTAYWHSVFKNTEFYDKDGKVINNNDLKFNANSPTKHYDVNVSAPVKHIRLGLGISFEQHYLDQLTIYTKDGESFLLFDEGLRFDKMYMHLEVPFKYDSQKEYSISWNLRLGWFGYTNIKRFNFTGERPFALSPLVASGITADYEIYPKVYLFLFPNFEYKLYDNSRTDASVKIHHNIFTADIIGGLRIDLGRLSN